jgi:hypothetical protein
VTHYEKAKVHCPELESIKLGKKKAFWPGFLTRSELLFGSQSVGEV